MVRATLDETSDLILGERTHLLAVARRLVRCEADAEDLVQDAILRALRARARFEPGTSVRAWTTTILRRLHLTSALRARRRDTDLDTDAGGLLETVAAESGSAAPVRPPRFADLLDRLDDPVKRSLERVPEVHRVPFLLATVDEMTCSEIAACLGVPEGTVMSRIHRARERLKRDLVYEHAPSARETALRLLPAAAVARPYAAAV